MSKTNLFRDEKKYTTHRVKYSLKDKNQDFYSIDEHQDSCKFTLIVYLDKSPEVRDEFWVGNHQIEENLWSRNNNAYRCLVFGGILSTKVKFLVKGIEIFFVSFVIKQLIKLLCQSRVKQRIPPPSFHKLKNGIKIKLKSKIEESCRTCKIFFYSDNIFTDN